MALKLITVILRMAMLCAELYVVVSFHKVSGRLIEAKIVSGTLYVRQIGREIDEYQNVFNEYPRDLADLDNHQTFEPLIDKLELVYIRSIDGKQFYLSSNTLDRIRSEKIKVDELRSTYPLYMFIIVGSMIIFEIFVKPIRSGKHLNTKRDYIKNFFRRAYFILAFLLIGCFIFSILFSAIS